MIEGAVEELAPLVGMRPACRALGAAPATIYRRRRPEGYQNADLSCRNRVVLVDQATKTISPLDVRHDADPRDLRDAFRSQKLKSSMRTLLVVVLCIDPQDAIEMPRTEDEKPVQAVGANGLHPTFGEGVRIRSPDRRADHPDRGVQVLDHAALSYSWRRD